MRLLEYRFFIIIIAIVQIEHYVLSRTNCTENSALLTSYRATVQSAEIILVILDSCR